MKIIEVESKIMSSMGFQRPYIVIFFKKISFEITKPNNYDVPHQYKGKYA